MTGMPPSRPTQVMAPTIRRRSPEDLPKVGDRKCNRWLLLQEDVPEGNANSIGELGQLIDSGTGAVRPGAELELLLELVTRHVGTENCPVDHGRGHIRCVQSYLAPPVHTWPLPFLRFSKASLPGQAFLLLNDELRQAVGVRGGGRRVCPQANLHSRYVARCSAPGGIAERAALLTRSSAEVVRSDVESSVSNTCTGWLLESRR